MSVAGPVLNGSSVSSGLWGTDLGGKSEGSRICQGRYAEQGCRAGLRVGGGGRAGLQGVVGESEPGCRAGLRVGGWEWVQRREGRAGLQSENGVGAGQGGSAERGCREMWASGGMQRGEAERGCREWGGGRAGCRARLRNREEELKRQEGAEAELVRVTHLRQSSKPKSGLRLILCLQSLPLSFSFPLSFPIVPFSFLHPYWIHNYLLSLCQTLWWVLGHNTE